MVRVGIVWRIDFGFFKRDRKWTKRHTPGAEAPICYALKRAKTKVLAYLEARAAYLEAKAEYVEAKASIHWTVTGEAQGI